MTEPYWTLDELTRRVGEALTAVADAGGYAGAPNGRVREVPDARVIRWYATKGLLDRPVMRGRTAIYGPRHLLQLVAIKRRQAEGKALAAIQAELIGAPDPVLRQLAGVPPALLDPGPDRDQPVPDQPGRPRFWGAAPAAAPAPAPAAAGSPPPTSAAAGVLTGVPLDAGAILLLPAAPDPDDVAAIRAAAGPLLDLLNTRGLLATEGRSPR